MSRYSRRALDASHPMVFKAAPRDEPQTSDSVVHMTTNDFRLPRFTPGPDYLACYGRNHHDSGEKGTCNYCLRDVVRDTETKKIYDVRSRINAAERVVEDYCCWRGVHVCDEALVRVVAKERDRKIAEGELVLGQRAIVTRGRKVAKGTEGVVTFIRRDFDYNGIAFVKLGLVDDAGTTHWVKADYCTATNQQPAPVVAEAVADAPKPAAAPRTKGSHADCTHEATKAARAACRKARANS